jgi:uncharacterized protein (DUF924 family)
MQQPQLLTATPADVLAFWREAGPQRWFKKDEGFDARFRARFLAAHEAAAAGACDGWATSADGLLALLILLDQFPRNAFRGQPRMFATDGKARAIAAAALEAGLDQQVPAELRNFVYLPFAHSEALADQDRAVALARTLGDDALHWAVVHRDIIERFGRFPHRNEVLGRATTPQERQFLDEGGFTG